MRLKVCDGDFIVVSLATRLSNEGLQEVQERFANWVSARGLQHVDVTVINGSKVDSGGNAAITVLSVNDVFDNQVLGESGK